MTAIARTTLAALLVLPGLSCAQDRSAAQERKHAEERKQNRPDDYGLAQQHRERTEERLPDRAPRRLESVTWNSVKHELTWVISKGEKQEGTGYKPTTTEKYEIDMDSATMTFNGETRRFSKQEAVNVHALMDLISKYAVDSTIWWDQGKGDPVDGRDKENIAVLHVTARQPQPATALGQVRSQISELEKKLAELKELEEALEDAGAVRLASRQ